MQNIKDIIVEHSERHLCNTALDKSFTVILIAHSGTAGEYRLYSAHLTDLGLKLGNSGSNYHTVADLLSGIARMESDALGIATLRVFESVLRKLL